MVYIYMLQLYICISMIDEIHRSKRKMFPLKGTHASPNLSHVKKRFQQTYEIKHIVTLVSVCFV